MGKCDICGDNTLRTYIGWDSERGWHASCHECRMVPEVTAPGEWKFIRVGGN